MVISVVAEDPIETKINPFSIGQEAIIILRLYK